MVGYINLVFLDVEPALHARNKFHFIMAYNYLKILILFDNIFKRSLYESLLEIMVYIFSSYNIVICFSGLYWPGAITIMLTSSLKYT